MESNSVDVDSTGGVPPCVALCFGTFPPQHNGGSDFVARLAGALAESGSRVVVVTSTNDESVVEAPHAGVSVQRIVDDWTLDRGGRRSRGAVERLLKAEGIDVLHVLFPDSVVQEDYMLPAILGAGRVPLVTTFWNLGLGRRSKMRTRLTAAALLARSRVLTSHDPFYLRSLRRVALHRPVHWLPAGSNIDGAEARAVTREELRARLGLGTRTRIAYFGQIDPTRGLEDLFHAVALARGSHDVELVMVGSAGREDRYRESGGETWDVYRRVRDLPAQLGIEDAVIWTRHLPGPEVAAHLRAADFCVLPYRRNSIGRSALAAAFEAGAPVVLGGTPANVTPLVDGRHVALVRPGDPTGLAAVILHLAGDPAARDRLAKGASEAARLFAWPRIAASARAAYDEAVR